MKKKDYKKVKDENVLLSLEIDRLKRKLQEADMLVDALNYKVAFLTNELKKLDNEKEKIN